MNKNIKNSISERKSLDLNRHPLPLSQPHTHIYAHTNTHTHTTTIFGEEAVLSHLNLCYLIVFVKRLLVTCALKLLKPST